MKHKRNTFSYLLFVMTMFFMGTIWLNLDDVRAEIDMRVPESQASNAPTTIGFAGLEPTASGGYAKYHFAYRDMYCDDMCLEIEGMAYNASTIICRSSNEEVIELCEDSCYAYGKYNCSVAYEVKNYGASDLSFTVDGNTISVRIYVLPQYTAITSHKMVQYDTLRIAWKPLENISGYRISGYNIYKATVPEPDSWIFEDSMPTTQYKRIQTVSADSNLYAEDIVDWNQTYLYVVCPYITLDDGTVMAFHKESSFETVNADDYELNFREKAPSFKFKSMKLSGQRNITVSWNKMAGAKCYAVYGSTIENGKYKKLATIKDVNTTSYIYKKAPLGSPYYMKVACVYPNGKRIDSDAKSVYVKGTKKVTAKQYNIHIHQKNKLGQYDWLFGASSDKVIYYVDDSNKLHAVCYNEENHKIYDYQMIKTGNFKLAKKVSLCKHDCYGGIYRGTDDNFYVAVGYNNVEESRSKVVIKLIQYSKSWKKLKTGIVRGNATNVFEGIVTPFSHGNCRMDMGDNRLYLTTSRTMFQLWDGLNHQSNIDFVFDTRDMKLVGMGPMYTSHSFNQFVRFHQGDLYLLNQGDGSPRSLSLGREEDVLVNEKRKISWEGVDINYYKEYDFFPYTGQCGENYTGAFVGGMEVGTNNVISVGTSQPQNYTIKGATGNTAVNREICNENVYITVTNKETGKNKLIWLTKYNPKSRTTAVGEARLLKLSDDRFIILYSTTKKSKDTLHYVLIDNNGKVLKKKDYEGIKFTASTQPILYNNAIVWTDAYTVGDYAKKRNGTGFVENYGEYKVQTVFCRIPIL